MDPTSWLDMFTAPWDDPRRVPKTVVVAAHPDDEVVGLGARLPRLREGLFVHVTDGSPRDLGDARANGFSTREEYAACRRRELEAALALAGISAQNLREAGVVDQDTAHQMPRVARWLAGLFRTERPAAVITHPYEGGHPDHDAAAFCVHAAIRLLEAEGEVPMVFEMTSYFNRNGYITPGEFLPGTGEEPVTVKLSDPECDLKQRMLACYPTQQGTLQYFPVGVERFRAAPHYDFSRPPHEGTLFYEMFGWGGMTGSKFCALACAAMDDLDLDGYL